MENVLAFSKCPAVYNNRLVMKKVVMKVRKNEIPASWLGELGDGPDQVFQVSIEPVPSGKITTRWADTAAKLAGALPLEEVSDVLQEARRDFREGFAFRTPPHFENEE